MDTDFIRGIVVPILTPIDEQEQIDEAKLRQQVDFVVDGGVDGILAFGSNGEFYMAEEDEMEQGLHIILEQSHGRVPVYMGIGAIRTSKCIRIAKMAERLGANGISILQPMFLKPTEDELFAHFSEIAKAVPNLPVLLYNNPGRTGYTLKASLIERLATEVDNICGMKDSSGDITQTIEFIRRTRNSKFRVLGGKDTLIYASLMHGAVGAIATTANFVPSQVSSIYEHYLNKEYDAALEAQLQLFHVRIAMDTASFPVATKDYANLVGLDVGNPYAPSKPSSGAVLEHLAAVMEEAYGADILVGKE